MVNNPLIFHRLSSPPPEQLLSANTACCKRPNTCDFLISWISLPRSINVLHRGTLFLSVLVCTVSLNNNLNYSENVFIVSSTSHWKAKVIEIVISNSVSQYFNVLPPPSRLKTLPQFLSLTQSATLNFPGLWTWCAPTWEQIGPQTCYKPWCSLLSLCLQGY